MRASTLQKQKNQILIQGLLVILSAALFCGWALSPSNFFQFDDYQWQWRTQTTSYGNLFNIIPYAPYNDRPVGAVFLKVLFGAFGVNNVLHHCVLLLVHTVSCLLFFCLLRVVLREYLRQAGTESWKNNIPWVASIFFAGWTTSTLRVVSWDAAIFDLLSAPLVLLSAICYLKAQARSRAQFFISVGCVLFYGLALRTKEMVVALPCMLACISIWDHVWQRRCLHRRAPFNPTLLIALLALMVIYVARILWIKSANHDLSDPSNPYFISTSPTILMRNIIRYTAMYFNPIVNEYIVGSPKDALLFHAAWGSLAVLVVIISLNSFLRNEDPMILVPILFLMQLAPVLPMQNTQSRLYLYLPSMELSVLLATVLCLIAGYLKNVTGSQGKIIIGMTSFVLLFFVSTNGVNPQYKNFYLSVGRENIKIYDSLRKISHPPHGSTVYIENIPEWVTPYCMLAKGSGDGDSVRSFFNDGSLKTKIEKKSYSTSKEVVTYFRNCCTNTNY